MRRIILPLKIVALMAVTAPAAAQEPEAPKTASQVSRFGITWTFDREYPVGQFVNGDWWVAGPVKIVNIDPASVKTGEGRVVNGSMIDPVISGDSGFDSKKKYQPELNVALGVDADQPLVIAPGASLLSSISSEDGKGDRPLETIAILTVLDEAPPADAFRPGYMAGEKKLYRYRDVDTDKLTKLKVVGDPPAWESINTVLERPFIDFAPNWNRYHVNPRKHLSAYGRDTSQGISTVTMMLLSDHPLEQKRRALIDLIQMGIDLDGVLAHWETHEGLPFPWRSDGGHSSGRKWPILFAGAMLGDERMLSVDQRAGGNFHEDAQTTYVTPAHIEKTNSDEWRPPYDGKRGKQAYTPAMLGMPEWVGNTQPGRGNAHWAGHPYRLGGNPHSFHGMTLGVLAMGLKAQWGHDVWFDYQTRYTAIMSGQPDPFAKLLGYEPVDGSVREDGWPAWQLYWKSKWPYQMWRAHWDTFYELPAAEQLREAARR